MRWGLALVAVGALVLTSERAGAIGHAASGDVEIDATGYLRLTDALLHYREQPAPLPSDDDGVVSAVTRLILQGTLSEELSYETNLFLELSRSPGQAAGGSLATAGSFASPYRSSQLAWQFWDSDHFDGQLGIDRLHVQIEADPLTLTVGRFPINYGVTNVLSPNDFFAPFGATAVNTVFKPGVDALRLAWAIDELSSIELVRALGYEDDDTPSWRRSALIGRASTVVWEFEGALVGGKLAERWIAGASLQGGLGPLMLRSEGHASFADSDANGELDGEIREAATLRRDELAARLAVGLDMSFDFQNTTLGAEYGFFSDGVASGAEIPTRALLRFPDDLPYFGKHYVGAILAGEIIPIVRGAITSLVNVLDGSGLVSGSLQYDAADEVSLAGGLLLPWGRGPSATPEQPGFRLESELGSWPLVAFVESRAYF